MTIEQLNASIESNLLLVVKSEEQLKAHDTDHFLLLASKLSERVLVGGNRLCLEEGTLDELSAFAQGTAFFISPNTIATAAHVLLDANEYKSNDISNIRFIKGFKKGAFAETDEGYLIPKENVFHPKSQTLDSQCMDFTSMDQDWALVEVLNKNNSTPNIPEPFLLSLTLTEGTAVHCPGHPLGLPTNNQDLYLGNVLKIEDDKTFFEVTNPTFVGNSGSPILNMKGDVIGIVSRGTGLLVQDGNCAKLTTPPTSYEGTECQKAITFKDKAVELGAVLASELAMA